MHELEVELDAGLVHVTFDGVAISEDEGDLDVVQIFMVDSCSSAEEGPYQPSLPERLHIESRCWEYLLSDLKDRRAMAEDDGRDEYPC